MDDEYKVSEKNGFDGMDIDEKTNFLVSSVYSNDVQGFPQFMFPWSLIIRKSFEYIVKHQLLKNEEPAFPFMLYVDTDFVERDQKQREFNQKQMQDPNSQNNNQQVKLNRSWVAFLLTNKGNLYYAKWQPLSTDSGQIRMELKHTSIDINRSVIPWNSEMKITTLTKEFEHAKHKFTSLEFIRNSILDSINASESHFEDEDGDRIYDQGVANDNIENEEDWRL